MAQAALPPPASSAKRWDCQPNGPPLGLDPPQSAQLDTSSPWPPDTARDTASPVTTAASSLGVPAMRPACVEQEIPFGPQLLRSISFRPWRAGSGFASSSACRRSSSAPPMAAVRSPHHRVSPPPVLAGGDGLLSGRIGWWFGGAGAPSECSLLDGSLGHTPKLISKVAVKLYKENTDVKQLGRQGIQEALTID
ncbi:hypothetical protein NDU88_007543 [Pleurodeles waltl]|uniref:Uncharacterized protein n=1 Tax=Pleurodeles waltl TaxID=8319 RepID=A0AAV7QS72_PLEWA|nr:hypothetical protein NDU88_007543 [Pleurodeles waltl]